MERRALYNPGIVTLLLLLELVPLLLFPAASYSLKTQEWWLPVLLVIMVVVAIFQIIVRRTVGIGPWYLLNFAQGFNIISRLMMIWAHSTEGTKAVTINWGYIVLTLISMGMSAFFLWYNEQAETRMAFLPK